jgi:hypothetical protein
MEEKIINEERNVVRGEKMNKRLPYVCTEHPDGEIRYSYTTEQYILNGYPAGDELKTDEKWECVICGRELSEEQRRKNER